MTVSGARLGVRELRTDLPAAIRRAAAGETTTITVNGRAAAVLAPLGAGTHAAATDLSALIAAGAVIAPRRGDRYVPDTVVTVWRNARLDLLLREVRG